MTGETHSAGGLWRFMRRMNRRVAGLIARGAGPGRMVLVVTTTGRRSGLPRVTPLQYEEVGGDYYVGSARGAQADWYRNVLADPCVEVLVKGRRFPASAEAVSDPVRVADFLALRLKRHPVMIGLLMRLEGLPLRYRREHLLRFATGKTLVILHPPMEQPVSL